MFLIYSSIVLENVSKSKKLSLIRTIYYIVILQPTMTEAMTEASYHQVTWKYDYHNYYSCESDLHKESAETMYTELIENEFYALEWVLWESVVNGVETVEAKWERDDWECDWSKEHKKQFANCIKNLTETPAYYEELGMRKDGQLPPWISRNNKKERYWFMMVLHQTPYTLGEVNFAGWNSMDDEKKAREASEEDNLIEMMKRDVENFVMSQKEIYQVTWKYKEEDGYHGEYDMEYEDAKYRYSEFIENESYALEWVVWEKVINDGEDFEVIERWKMDCWEYTCDICGS